MEWWGWDEEKQRDRENPSRGGVNRCAIWCCVTLFEKKKNRLLGSIPHDTFFVWTPYPLDHTCQKETITPGWVVQTYCTFAKVTGMSSHTKKAKHTMTLRRVERKKERERERKKERERERV